MRKRIDEGRRGPLRCAVYTRKSNEEGLEQDFNSLHAQREACEAYIRSQVGEGWRLVPNQYDDGGFSGGNIDRPGLTKLLADVDTGNVDIIVVYKVDRLTRSLMDFAKIVERLDARSVSFVSITQAFNTTTSMGRLTLNVLLSFAQFEREVTGERIRDKIAASKAKGMWMGGNPPLGYDLVDRKLIPNGVEAEQVRHIFERYNQLRSVPKLAVDLDRTGFRSKSWTSRRGTVHGGMRFRPGAICYMLQNRIYIGEIVHKGQTFPGNQAPIVDRDLFDAVQEVLAYNRRVRGTRSTRAASSPLAGIVYDAAGNLMSPTFGYGRGKKAYRYYAAPRPLEGSGPGRANRPMRLSAPELETLVLGRLGKLLDQNGAIDWPSALHIVRRIEIRSTGFSLLLHLNDGNSIRDVHRVRQMMQPDEVIVVGDRIKIEICQEWTRRVSRSAAGRFTQQPKEKVSDQPLISLLRTAHRRLHEHNMSPLRSDTHSQGKAPSEQRLRRVLAFGLLAPDVQAAIFDGKAEGISPAHLLSSDLPLAWSDQRTVLL